MIPHSIRHHRFGGCLSVLVSRTLSASLSHYPHFFFPGANKILLQCVRGGKSNIENSHRTESFKFTSSHIGHFKRKLALPSLSLYIKSQGKTLGGWDTCSSKTGPYDCLLNGHFPLLPHKHNSDPITVPDDYVLWKVDSCGFSHSSKR